MIYPNLHSGYWGPDLCLFGAEVLHLNLMSNTLYRSKPRELVGQIWLNLKKFVISLVSITSHAEKIKVNNN